MRGLFIALEGSDGSGKTTVLNGIRNHFDKAGIEVLYTREPGGPPIAEKIRALLLDPMNGEMTAMTEALLYAASRAQHVQEVVLPALEKGAIVLTDRFVLSSLAYQGAARGLGLPAVAEINRYATGGLMPDLTLFLDVDPVTVLRRKAETAKKDRLEEAGDAFFQKVYNGYQQAIPMMPHVVRIDASKPAEAVIEATWQAIEKSHARWQKGATR